jgi:hypothetical protein
MQRLAQIAERGKLDSMLLSDTVVFTRRIGGIRRKDDIGAAEPWFVPYRIYRLHVAGSIRA